MTRQMKRLLKFLGLCLVLSLILSACSQNGKIPSGKEMGNSTQIENEKLKVYTSFYPLYDFVSKIAGERAEVVNLIPPGTESHDFEPNPKEIIELSKADIFVYNGSGFELWIEKVIQGLDTSNMTVLNMSEHVDLLTREETGEVDVEREEEGDDKSEAEAEEGQEEEGIYDPHIWLDPIRMKDVALTIKEALIEADNAGKETYESNYNSLISELDKLDSEFKEVAINAKRKEIIVSHAAFGYLTKRYGLQQIAISGLSPSDEPSQKELQEIIKFAKENDVKYILFETLVSGKIAEIVREQIGAEALRLNPIEGLTIEELAQGEDYFSVMRKNLEAISKAVQ